MTHNAPMRKPSKTKPKRAAKASKTPAPKWKRSRARARQVYLSTAEDKIFEQMMKRQNCNASELVRTWLDRAQAQFLRRKNKHEAPPAEEDPRQLRIAVEPKREASEPELTQQEVLLS
jgi:hypothetical protein